MVDLINNPEIKYTQIFINNEFVNSLSGKTFPTITPVYEWEYPKTLVQEGDKADVDKAVIAARNAFKRGSVWRTIDASERGRLLFKLADLVSRDTDHLASLETLDNGMVYKFAQWMIGLGIETVRYNAGFADKIHGKTIPVNGPHISYTRKEPIGVCALIIAFNAPVMLTLLKMGTALAAGNTVVIKPDERTPLTALYLAALVKEAGFPPGVVNVVPGYGPTVGAALSEHMDIDLISFTGSAEVGKIIQSAAGNSNFKKVILELGGKSPLVVFEDADIEETVNTAVNSAFVLSGQACAASTRLYIQDSIYDDFVKRVVRKADRLLVGDPYLICNEQGPMITEQHNDRVFKYIDIGRKEGAKLLCGGRVNGSVGHYIQPTVFSEVTEDMTIAKEEIFGPVLCVFRFKTLDEVIDRCNHTKYGLYAGIFTKDIDRAMQFAQAVKAGTVCINTYLSFNAQVPFGGYKQSGIGRELSEDGLNEYLETKSIYIKNANKIS